MPNSLKVAIFLFICFLPGIIGLQFSPGQWYTALSKPSWTPPGWIFAPVWTILYFMIGISGYWAWNTSDSRNRKAAFCVFALQLALNATWSWVFFGLHNISVSVINILALWVFILMNIVFFYRLSAVAGYLLIPYLVWVSFAAVLNWSIWRLNT
jgi:benzodiazapine receptor